VIHGNSGNNTIVGGYGNDTITDGPGTSKIDTGFGRNIVVIEDGDDILTIGTGENTITGGPGKTRYIVGYGGKTVITDWHAGVTIDLSAWPDEPEVTVSPDGIDITLGASVIVLNGVQDVDAVRATLIGPDVE
jgi:Ca2+-binding RTX toxin-like protein